MAHLFGLASLFGEIEVDTIWSRTNLMIYVIGH